ncbi:GntR family transcriptional regulator [Streptosporangium sp. CA-115845]|uniref:GntR family transcriptional regulator n=1 Tax=Streptosporangium sp. CA-115845 TaxID=3240071 RepID=UPI003D8C4D73
MPLAEYQRPIKKQLLRSAAYDLLRDAIIRGELEPGEVIKDSDLAAHIGLSRTPVREALTRLAEIGLVEFKSGVYTRVSRINRRDIDATLTVLRALDQIAVLEAVPRLRPEDLDEMREANERFRLAVRDKDIDLALLADDELHSVLIEASGNPVVKRLIEELHPAIHRVLYRKFSNLLGGRDTVDHHKQLIELCASGQAEAAAECSAAHWSLLSTMIGELFDTDALDTDEA